MDRQKAHEQYIADQLRRAPLHEALLNAIPPDTRYDDLIAVLLLLLSDVWNDYEREDEDETEGD